MPDAAILALPIDPAGDLGRNLDFAKRDHHAVHVKVDAAGVVLDRDRLDHGRGRGRKALLLRNSTPSNHKEDDDANRDKSHRNKTVDDDASP